MKVCSRSVIDPAHGVTEDNAENPIKLELRPLHTARLEIVNRAARLHGLLRPSRERRRRQQLGAAAVEQQRCCSIPCSILPNPEKLLGTGRGRRRLGARGPRRRGWWRRGRGRHCDTDSASRADWRACHAAAAQERPGRAHARFEHSSRGHAARPGPALRRQHGRSSACATLPPRRRPDLHAVGA